VLGRPLTARSVLASALLGEDPPELPVAHLVALAGLFGISPNRARVALSRMVASGEAVTDGDGRYRLGGRLLERRLRQEASLRAEVGPWDGAWHLVVVMSASRPAEHRAARRRRLAAARLACRREGLWLRPANLPVPPDLADDPDLSSWSAVPDGDPVALAASLWDLRAWAARAEVLLGRLAAGPAVGPDDLAPGFALSAAVLRHLQADPLLPDGLTGPGWPGPALRTAYAGWDAAYRDVLATWGRSVRPA
jgi:phenylacetic acid degradation operon negative regulatory protein